MPAEGFRVRVAPIVSPHAPASDHVPLTLALNEIAWRESLLALTLNGCVFGYRKYPRHQLSKPYPAKEFKQAYYYVEGTSLAGG